MKKTILKYFLKPLFFFFALSLLSLTLQCSDDDDSKAKKDAIPDYTIEIPKGVASE